MTIRPVW